MTSNLGEAILVKTLDARCNGVCGGLITLTTDEVHAAYAVTDETERGYIEQDSPGAVKHDDGSIVVSCGSVHPLSEDRCDGTATFTKADLNEAYWTAPTDRAVLMTAMDRS